MKVKCKSGLMGWRMKLQKLYKTIDEFKYCCEMYSIHTRLGYKTPKTAWLKNPLIEGSVDPSDFRKVPKNKS